MSVSDGNTITASPGFMFETSFSLNKAGLYPVNYVPKVVSGAAALTPHLLTATGYLQVSSTRMMCIYM